MVIGYEDSSQISVSSTPFILPPGGGPNGEVGNGASKGYSPWGMDCVR